ncbi:MAG TPA: excinuclease ATPase subunit [Oxalobacteraceae bacterium]|nr:excinuclease ATPase subunit [Oxalobacteraceae bacterium]
MKKWISSFVILGAALTAASAAQARDTKHLLPIAAAMETADTQEKLVGSVKFYFGDQKHPKVLDKLGSDFSNRKTNAFGKSDETACNWAFLSALVALEQRAISLGANAIVNVVSYYKKNTHSSQSEFECHAGAVMAGVALKGDFVKVSGK